MYKVLKRTPYKLYGLGKPLNNIIWWHWSTAAHASGIVGDLIGISNYHRPHMMLQHAIQLDTQDGKGKGPLFWDVPRNKLGSYLILLYWVGGQGLYCWLQLWYNCLIDALIAIESVIEDHQ